MKTQKRYFARLCRYVSLVLVVALVGSVAGTRAVADPTDDPFPIGPVSSGGLRILLTNDDGFDAPGIRAMYEALTAARPGGRHQVIVVAPETNQSGTGASISRSGSTLTVTHRYPGVASVSGTPADAVELGLGNVFFAFKPDIVISGVNNGENVGAGTIHSGTIGAAVTAINDEVPAIAVSRWLDGAATPARMADAADFVVEILEDLIEHRPDSGELLPRGTGLSVNYPIDWTGKIELTSTGRAGLDHAFEGQLPTVGQSATFVVSGASYVLREPVPEPVDTIAFYLRRSVTITPITGNYDVGGGADRSGLLEDSPFADLVERLNS